MLKLEQCKWVMKEGFEDTKGVIRIRKSNTMAKRKRTNSDLQNITHRNKDRVTGTANLDLGVQSITLSAI
jgi:hypothetical protein